MEVPMRKSTSPLLLKQRQQREVLLLLGWYAEAIHRGVANYAQSAGWVLDASQSRSLNPPRSWNGDGILCVLGLDKRINRLVATTRALAVNIGYGRHHIPGVPTVTADHDKITKLAVDHFVERGFKNLAFYMRSGKPGERGRMEAFRRHVRNTPGLKFHLFDCVRGGAGEDADTSLKYLRTALRKAPRPLAAMAEYDDLALDIIKACRVESISVPEEVAVLGVNNDPLRCPFAPVPLSSIDDNLEGIGYAAARILDGLMKGEPPPTSCTLISPVGITTRQSTDILAISHLHVARALKLIWLHYREPLNAQDVAANIPMSYRRLHEAFVANVGRTMAGEIRRKRVEHAIQLLATTDFKLGAIAEEAGFSDVNRFIKVFHGEKGINPGEFRKRCHSRASDRES